MVYCGISLLLVRPYRQPYAISPPSSDQQQRLTSRADQPPCGDSPTAPQPQPSKPSSYAAPPTIVNAPEQDCQAAYTTPSTARWHYYHQHTSVSISFYSPFARPYHLPQLSRIVHASLSVAILHAYPSLLDTARRQLGSSSNTFYQHSIDPYKLLLGS